MEKQRSLQNASTANPPMDEQPAEEPSSVQKGEDGEYPHGIKLWIITAALYSTMFLVALVSFTSTLIHTVQFEVNY
jgi:hypothetical protein